MAQFSPMPLATALFLVAFATDAVGRAHALAAPAKAYRYFGYGSNVLPSTMRALRGIDVHDVTAAVLPGYELRFGPAAFVRPVAARDADERVAAGVALPAVHGLLYTLAAEDFAKVGTTEGVPFGYRWQSCRVYPYRGDGRRAGEEAWTRPEAVAVQAYTLGEPARAQPPGPRGDPPPSGSYLGLIREGARRWQFDRAYQEELAAVRAAAPGGGPFPEGWEGPALRWAEKVTSTSRSYMIDRR